MINIPILVITVDETRRDKHSSQMYATSSLVTSCVLRQFLKLGGKDKTPIIS